MHLENEVKFLSSVLEALKEGETILLTNLKDQEHKVRLLKLNNDYYMSFWHNVTKDVEYESHNSDYKHRVILALLKAGFGARITPSLYEE
jgi:hypothetical protein